MSEEYAWKVEGEDLDELAKILGVEKNTIAVTRTRADTIAPPCPECGRQIGLLDIANTALSVTAHNSDFLKEFFQGASKEKPTEGIFHRVLCYNCGTEQNVTPGWATGSGFDWVY